MSGDYIIRYMNDVGPNDDGFWEWWEVIGSNGHWPLAKCDSEKEAQLIADALTYANQKQSEWQDIATAPKDGTSFLAWFAGVERVDWCHWQAARYPGMPEGRVMPEGWRDGFIVVYAANDPRGPSHWMPLPAPPLSRNAPDTD